MKRFIFFMLFFTSGLVFSQHQDKVDFIRAEVRVRPHMYSKSIEGRVLYEFKVLQNVDSIFLDARNMEFQSVRLNLGKAKFTNDGKTITIKKKFKKGRSYGLMLKYMASPKQAVYFLGSKENVGPGARLRYEQAVEGQTLSSGRQVWTQGQGKYTSHWLPSFDAMEEKVEFDLNITTAKDLKVIANGKLISKENGPHDTVDWSFDMQKPMSSYLLAFVIGVYDKQELVSKRGIPIENYHYPRDSLLVEPTYRYTKEIFDFLETEIGVPYPWQNYKQVPVRDFLYAGMENTGATLFSDGYVIDSMAFVDKNYVNVNAHEMAHQWFGNLVTEKDGNHHWLHEGFATYYAYLAEKELFGDEHFYWKLYDSAKRLHGLSKEGKGEALTDPKASSLTFYEKGAWALVLLRKEVGEEAFGNGIKEYLETYGFKNATISDFLEAMEKASDKSLSAFSDSWLRKKAFPYGQAKEVLTAHSKPLADFLKLKWELTTSLEDRQQLLRRYWDATKSDELKSRIISKYHKSLSNDFIKNAFESKSIKIRQALSTCFDKVPQEIKPEYESLLKDKSYLTIENALYRLWISFPRERATYLDRTKGITGLPNKNVRLLWLLLAILTKDYDDAMKEGYISELFRYTSPDFSMETRQGAFGWIGEVFKYSDQNLLDLFNASVHHSWQFRKFARTLLDGLLSDGQQRNRIMELSKGLKGSELRYIQSKLQEL